MLTRKVGLFLQVRLNSTRLPGKSILPLCGQPLVVRTMERMAFLPADIRVLVTTKDCEEYFKQIALPMGWNVFSGSVQNVLKRFVDCAIFYEIDTIIRATGDNPLLSSEIASETLELFNKNKADLAFMEPVPYGSGVEVINKEALQTALKNTIIPYHLEHVTPYIYENKEKFKIVSDKFHIDEDQRPDVRISVDTREDYEKMNYLFRSLIKKKSNYSIDSVIKTYDTLSFTKYKCILFLTVSGGMHGIGHLKRSLFLASMLKNDFIIFFSIKDVKEEAIDLIESNDYSYIFYENLKDHALNEGIFDRVIVDLRDTEIADMKFYKDLGPVISIDDMGAGSAISNVNIKTLPALNDKKYFNFDGIEYLILKNTNINGKTLNNPPKNILITFGGSDPDELTTPAAAALDYLSYNVQAVIGPFFTENIIRIGNCDIVHNPEDMETYIDNADLVITSFGMTFMESLVQKKPVLILNPTIYHDKLTEEFEYPYIIKREKEFKGNIKEKIKSMIDKMTSEGIFDKELQSNPLMPFFTMNFGKGIDKIISVIKNYQASSSICPYCCDTPEEPVYRINNYNMFYCKKCRIYYTDNLIKNDDIYNDRYFTDDYKMQYGKTYEEDKDNIRKISEDRIKIIKKYNVKGHLLDFGSGLGFFSETAEKHGFRTTSMDVSDYAVDFIKGKLKLNAVKANETYLEKSKDLYDIITSFYLIEHIKDFEKLIFLFYCHLNKGGILALSTPNAAGLSIKYKFSDYVKVHPKDHYRIFSPYFFKKLLKKYGFSKIKVKITGIHPERTIRPNKILKNKFINNIIVIILKIFALGDTFEIYAKKN
jgi:spore coat polysaccharide biosynthesis protein SpsF (cytidylyltransferase family)/spore coat polysaccharide biosynthesis predicted glycosyltransferase SpsG/2-polyprenyl-3-methyl-5-hydroxy-6-metoxy-1,4-benzoquinol methylase